MKKSLFFFLVFSFVVYSSCKDDDKDNVEMEKTVEPEIVLENEFVLYNQFSAENFFYNVEEQTVTSDTTADFDFAFAYYTYTNLHKYIIAAPASNELRTEWTCVNKSYKCKKETNFYKLPDNFSYSKFDTLKTVNGLNDVLNQSTIIYNEDNTKDCIFSDKYGWATGQMYGFKLASGKNGIMKITNISDYSENTSGNIRLYVKYDGD